MARDFRTKRGIKKMLNVLSLFSGIGAFEKALERVLFRVMNFCEQAIFRQFNFEKVA